MPIVTFRKGTSFFPGIQGCKKRYVLGVPKIYQIVSRYTCLHHIIPSVVFQQRMRKGRNFLTKSLLYSPFDMYVFYFVAVFILTLKLCVCDRNSEFSDFILKTNLQIESECKTIPAFNNGIYITYQGKLPTACDFVQFCNTTMCLLSNSRQ